MNHVGRGIGNRDREISLPRLTSLAFLKPNFSTLNISSPTERNTIICRYRLFAIMPII